MKSQFSFDSFKIDVMKYDIFKSLEFVDYKGNWPSENWTFEIKIRNPIFFEEKEKYLAGIDCNLALFQSNIQEEEKNNDKKNQKLLELNVGITGTFSVKSGADEELIEKITKIQYPTILLPYLRSCINSFLATAGIGSVIFPLVNMNKVAKKSNLKILKQ